jgi:hypothetical protein
MANLRRALISRLCGQIGGFQRGDHGHDSEAVIHAIPTHKINPPSSVAQNFTCTTGKARIGAGALLMSFAELRDREKFPASQEPRRHSIRAQGGGAATSVGLPSY